MNTTSTADDIGTGPPAGPARRAPDRGLPTVLMGLTLLSGIIDAVSYLGLGQLFLGKMTGNLIVLGISLGPATGFAIGAAAVALAAFLAGAVLAGRLHTMIARFRYRWINAALVIEAALLVAAAVVAVRGAPTTSTPKTTTLIVLIAVAMGFRNATVRKMAIPDMTTTLVTLTLADLASDSFLAGRRNPRLRRRIGVVAAIFGGALIGGFLVAAHGLVVPLVVCAALACALAVGYPAAHWWWARPRKTPFVPAQRRKR
ncbi:YoaK family protein [Saccharopolyspora cebuensis]|uniref:YoaK family protein n=1 Tax=Saccharopolyspora cebuensis TaxID=418759 RepID=A0ABV4CHM9_9PSEU